MQKTSNLTPQRTTKVCLRFHTFPPSKSCFNFPDATLEYAPLQLVQIYFDTATYDQIEKDVKMTLTAQIGLIGGTMGLLTGFSILSAVEILYFAAKLIMSLRIPQRHITAIP